MRDTLPEYRALMMLDALPPDCIAFTAYRGDLAPHVLGSLLELFAEQLFERGPGRTHPTLLVLEEAHHYLRQIPGDAETGMHSLAYERLAREGRKFQLALLISTQRPSEVSPTVLAQCGSWAVFRLTNVPVPSKSSTHFRSLSWLIISTASSSPL